MISKSEAIHQMFSQFGVPAYPSGNIPLDVTFPYITYTKGVGSSYESTLHYYDYTESELLPDIAMDKICDAFRHGGIHIEYDRGVIWAFLAHDDVHWYASPDEGDKNRKHRLADITICFEGEF